MQQFKKLLLLFAAITIAQAYIDIQLTSVSSSSDVVLNMPMTIEK